jgi:GTP-binding protein
LLKRKNPKKTISVLRLCWRLPFCLFFATFTCVEKFADEALIEVSSGSGGNGCVAFRREKYIPKGGPSGGDGGRGGDVVFTVRRNLRTLAHLRYRHTFKAENGQDGSGAGRYGKGGGNVIVPLPPGSIVREAETGRVVKDFSAEKTAEEGDFVYLKGGNGGWGNVRFKSSVNQAPRKALPGQPGKTVLLKVELHIMADVGLVGFPNAGKSSLLDHYTNARPKIAAYPFTTKIPNLGVLNVGGFASSGEDGGRDIVIADIPGLIEGASGGAGLGIRFLKHIARTQALAFLVDLGDDNYLEAFDVLKQELEAFSSELLRKKRLLVGTKADLPDTSERLARLSAEYPDEKTLGISVFSGDGLKILAEELVRLVDSSIDEEDE